MKMSVFRQRGAMQQMEHGECMKLGAHSDSGDMILHARLHGDAVLVGLQDGQAIVKPAAEGDERLSFEELYDEAISGHEFAQMVRQKVHSRDELALQYFELQIFLVPRIDRVRLRVRVKAKGQYDVGPLLKHLVREDIDFGKELHARFAAVLTQRNASSIESAGALRINAIAPEDAPQWLFLEEDEPEADPDEDPDEDLEDEDDA